jgi:hypothetical protein
MSSLSSLEKGELHQVHLSHPEQVGQQHPQQIFTLRKTQKEILCANGYEYRYEADSRQNAGTITY